MKMYQIADIVTAKGFDEDGNLISSFEGKDGFESNLNVFTELMLRKRNNKRIYYMLVNIEKQSSDYKGIVIKKEYYIVSKDDCNMKLITPQNKKM